MDFLLYGSIIIIAFIAIIIISSIRSSKKLRIRLENMFGEEPLNQDYDMESIASFHNRIHSFAKNEAWVDDITWDDLEMDKIFKRINICLSSVGEEYLYHLLHTQSFNLDELSTKESFIAYLKSNPNMRIHLQTILAKLGENDYNGLSGLMHNKELKQFNFHWLYSILAAIPLVGIVLIPFSLGVGIGVLMTSFTINIILHYTLRRKIDSYMSTLEYFSSMLWACKKICKLTDTELSPFIQDLQKDFKTFKSICNKILSISTQKLSDIDFITEYIKIIFLSDIRNYNKIIDSIDKNNDTFIRLYESIGEIDASISILSFRESLPFYCMPIYNDENKIKFSEIYHPMISNPVTNTANIENDYIITGSNASGKSTFIKSVAINAILAQTINTCTAKEYTSKLALVMTSMAVRDNISEGDSYFITEIKSLKRILDKVKNHHCFCFIDEILKGTNTIERIAASASVLRYLSDKDCLCLVASHDIELTSILSDRYDNYHFSEQINDDGIYFDYLLKKGPSQTRNAIKLLHFMDFDSGLVENAEALVDKFTSTKKWN